MNKVSENSVQSEFEKIDFSQECYQPNLDEFEWFVKVSTALNKAMDLQGGDQVSPIDYMDWLYDGGVSGHKFDLNVRKYLGDSFQKYDQLARLDARLEWCLGLSEQSVFGGIDVSI